MNQEQQPIATPYKQPTASNLTTPANPTNPQQNPHNQTQQNPNNPNFINDI
jgi:hypothetical protein